MFHNIAHAFNEHLAPCNLKMRWLLNASKVETGLP